ncbi:MAG: aldo/keto reductase [Rhodospirillaceae bacterium]|nr:aldo/keto reductase [Rhodospirillaceae bacterium]
MIHLDRGFAAPRSQPVSRGRFLALSGAMLAAAAAASRPAVAAEMTRKPIPRSKTGETLPVIGVGTNRFGRDGGATENKIGVIRTLLDRGGAVVDTAEAYGESEAVLGEIFTGLNARPKLFVASKLRRTGRADGVATMENSFKRLRTEVIDLMMVHNLVDTATQLPIMQEWKAAGRYRYVGASHSSPEEQEALAEVMAGQEIDVVQLNYSVDVRGPEQKLLPLAAERGIAVMANLPLGRGRLLEKVRGQPVPEWAAKELNCTSYAQLLLKFVVSHPAVTVAIPGTVTPKYMADNVGAGLGPMPTEAQRARIAAIWAA